MKKDAGYENIRTIASTVFRLPTIYMGWFFKRGGMNGIYHDIFIIIIMGYIMILNGGI